MIRIEDPKKCCGCTACMSVCPQNAITMKPDVLGFMYPKVDELLCVKCGLCEKVCAFNEKYDKSLNLPEPLSFGVRHKNINEVESSRSGAAFIAFSDWVIEHGGVVYGVGYKGHFRVAHKRAATKQERDEFKGSKYVQSDVGDCFRQIKKELTEGLLVLFSGTACQTAGLNSYVGSKLRKNLIVIDIVCHGSPSPFIWRDYLSYVEAKYKSTASIVNFRDKTKWGWSAHRESIGFANGQRWDSDIYTYLFYSHIMFRQSCGICHFCNLIRPSDITIADYWGWEKTNSTINVDDKGCSLVLCNTEKGKTLFNNVSDELTFWNVSLKDCMQPNLMKPSPIHRHRMNFEKDYAQKGFRYVLYRYGNVGLIYVIRKIWRKVNCKIRGQK